MNAEQQNSRASRPSRKVFKIPLTRGIYQETNWHSQSKGIAGARAARKFTAVLPPGHRVNNTSKM